MLSCSQYGIRSGLVTSVAICDIHENLLKKREENTLLVLYFVIFLKRFIKQRKRTVLSHFI